MTSSKWKVASKILLLFLLFPVFAFSQNYNSSAEALAAARLQTQGNLSAADIAAARDALAKEKQLQARQLQSQQFQQLEIQRPLEFKYANTIEDSIAILKLDSSMVLKDPAKAGFPFARYETLIFSRSLPSAFYEIQGMVSSDYPLKSGDNLELSLWGAIERQFTLSVNNQGNVFVEGAGLVNVANLTLGEAEKLLTKKLQSVYSGITQGRISVNLRTTTLSPTKVYVMGAVQRPGGYDLPGNANVFLALYRAGGPDDIGSVRNIIVRRANGDSVAIDLYNFLLKGQKIGEGVLRDGDLVFIPKAEKLIKATGAIGRPAIYELKGKETLNDLLFFAGGMLPEVDHTINLWRIGETGIPKVFEPGSVKDFADSGKEFQMQNGDSIFVFKSTRPNDNSIEVIGSVFYPGFYTWSADMGIKEAIALAGGLSSEAFTNRAIVQRLKPDSSFSYHDDDFENSLGLKLLAGDKVIVLDSRQLKNWRTVSITGFVKIPGEFEWQEGINALDLIILSGGFLPNAEKGEIIIERIVPGEQSVKKIRVPIKDNLPVEENKSLVLEPGDRVIAIADESFYEHEIIILNGAFRNPGSFSLAYRGETFKEFMKRTAKLDSTAYVKGGQLFRRTFVTDSLGEKILGQNYRINFDFERTLQGREKDIILQANDSIYIPFDMITVNIIGEVVSPGHMLWQKNWDAYDYIDAAGGLTINGDEDRIVLTYANGKRINAKKADDDPDPGSEIYVAYVQAPEPTKLTEIITAVGTFSTALVAIVGLILALK